MQTLFLTVSTLQQLPQALALGDSLRQHHPGELFVIGLCDDLNRLPAGLDCPYPLLDIRQLKRFPVAELSKRYNPLEFAGAAKPLFLQTAWERYPQAEQLVYLEPAVYLYQPLSDLKERLSGRDFLLTPHLLAPPLDEELPDEKYLQNTGLFHAGFLALRRSPETSRFLGWWSERVPERAYIDFCEGMCADQLWLMMTPVFFEGLGIVKHPGWHVGLWNLPERTLRRQGERWVVAGGEPLVFLNFGGLADNSGFFGGQTRMRAEHRNLIRPLLDAYRSAVAGHDTLGLSRIAPTYGQQPLRLPLPGWRGTLINSLKQTVKFIETVDVPRKMRN